METENHFNERFWGAPPRPEINLLSPGRGIYESYTKVVDSGFLNNELHIFNIYEYSLRL